jgi:hypothetical protein
MTSETRRSPRFAVQNTEWHRHFKLEGTGYLEHAHAIGKRVHEHLANRLGRVVLSWAERGPKERPVYETPLVVPDEAVLFTVLVMIALALALLAYRVMS